jgi:hypothetical protein
MTARSARTPLRFRLRHAILAVAAALLLTLLAAPAAFAASTYSGGADINDCPRYIPNDETAVAIHFTVATPNVLSPSTLYYVKVRFSPTSAPGGNSNRGFTWNPTSKQWIQERSEWTLFPQVPTDGTGQISGNAGWMYAKFGDTRLSGTYHIIVSLSTGGSNNTFNGDVDVPIKVVDMQTGGVWLHNGASVPSALAPAKRAEVDKYPLPDPSATPSVAPTVVGMSKTEANAVDDDSDGVVDNEGAAGAFHLSAPIGENVVVQLKNTVWPTSSTGVTYTTPDVDVALGGAEVEPPSAVTGLVVTPNDTTADLTWTAATDNTAVTAYNVYRFTNPASTAPYTGLPVKIATVPTTTYHDPSLPNDAVTYTYLVRAVDAATNVGPRATVSVVPPAAPTVFTGLAADAAVDLTWTNPASDFATVRVARAAGAAPATPAEGTIVYEGPASSCRDTGLTNGVGYFYSIWSRSAGGRWSTVASTGPFTPMAVSAITLKATAAIVNYQTATTLFGQIKMSGANAASAVQYEIWSGTTATNLTQTGLVSSTATGGILLRTRPLNKMYYKVRVTAGGDHLASPFSAVISVTPRVALSTPSTPSIVTHNAYFTLGGTLKPRHAASSRSVKLLYERLIKGHWVVQKASTWTRVANSASYSKYSARVRLWAAGKWRVRVYMSADSAHAATYSVYRYITAR